MFIKINPKKILYTTASISLISVASIFGIIEFKKTKNSESEKKALDKFYLDKLGTSHFTILKENRKEKRSEWMINMAYEWLKENKEHMSKDGYNWAQIEKMNKEAEWNEKMKLYSQDKGYIDGFAGSKKNPGRGLWDKTPIDIEAAYLYGYEEGEQARINKFSSSSSEKQKMAEK